MRLTPIHHRWYAAGSGGVYAWAVLEAGCGIDKAMQTAIKMDPNSGFGYQIRHRDLGEAEAHDRDVDILNYIKYLDKIYELEIKPIRKKINMRPAL